MLSQVQKTSSAGGPASRAGAALAIGVLALALGACSVGKRLKPGSEVGSEVRDPPGASEPYPHLGEVPERPKQTESADARREIARELVADREAARYTDEALRGGTEPSAPPPPPPVAALPEAPMDSTASVAQSVKPEGKTKKPGFFGRLFAAKEEKVETAGPAPLPAQPTGQVDVQQAPAAAQ